MQDDGDTRQEPKAILRGFVALRPAPQRAHTFLFLNKRALPPTPGAISDPSASSGGEEAELGHALVDAVNHIFAKSDYARTGLGADAGSRERDGAKVTGKRNSSVKNKAARHLHPVYVLDLRVPIAGTPRTDIMSGSTTDAPSRAELVNFVTEAVSDALRQHALLPPRAPSQARQVQRPSTALAVHEEVKRSDSPLPGSIIPRKRPATTEGSSVRDAKVKADLELSAFPWAMPDTGEVRARSSCVARTAAALVTLGSLRSPRMILILDAAPPIYALRNTMAWSAGQIRLRDGPTSSINAQATRTP